MALEIEVHTSEFSIKSGTSARTGKPYSIREQIGYVKFPKELYPVQIKLTLEDNTAPYQPGKYQLADNSFFVGRFNDLQIRPRLVPATQQAQKAVS